MEFLYIEMTNVREDVKLVLKESKNAISIGQHLERPLAN
jgi:hypothetical protein